MTAEACVHDDIVFYTGDRSILCYQCKEPVDNIIAALRAELREVREAAREVTELFYGSYRPNGKGLHCHMIPGRWDHDGSECVKCAAIQKLVEAVAE